MLKNKKPTILQKSLENVVGEYGDQYIDESIQIASYRGKRWDTRIDLYRDYYVASVANGGIQEDIAVCVAKDIEETLYRYVDRSAHIKDKETVKDRLDPDKRYHQNFLERIEEIILEKKEYFKYNASKSLQEVKMVHADDAKHYIQKEDVSIDIKNDGSIKINSSYKFDASSNQNHSDDNVSNKTDVSKTEFSVENLFGGKRLALNCFEPELVFEDSNTSVQSYNTYGDNKPKKDNPNKLNALDMEINAYNLYEKGDKWFKDNVKKDEIIEYNNSLKKTSSKTSQKEDYQAEDKRLVLFTKTRSVFLAAIGFIAGATLLTYQFLDSNKKPSYRPVKEPVSISSYKDNFPAVVDVPYEIGDKNVSENVKGSVGTEEISDIIEKSPLVTKTKDESKDHYISLVNYLSQKMGIKDTSHKIRENIFMNLGLDKHLGEYKRDDNAFQNRMIFKGLEQMDDLYENARIYAKSPKNFDRKDLISKPIIFPKQDI